MGDQKEFVILVNPVSGLLSWENKRNLLSGPSFVFNNCAIRGGETKNEAEFLQLAKDLAKEYTHIVVAGGDGTFCNVMNAVSGMDVTLAYLPFGTGNALGTALGYKKWQKNTIEEILETIENGKVKTDGFLKIAEKVRKGKVHSIDAIMCETYDHSQKGLMGGLGLVGYAIQESAKLRKNGVSSMNSYMIAAVYGIFGGYLGVKSEVTLTNGITSQTIPFGNMGTVLVNKHPFIGYGLNVLPGANLESRKVHGLGLHHTPWDYALTLASAKLWKNKFGSHWEADNIKITTKRPVYMQVDGEMVENPSTDFSFSICPNETRLLY